MTYGLKNSRPTPYNAPMPQAEAYEAAAKLKLFSPLQAAGAALVGLTLGATYALRRNYLIMGDAERARQTLIVGLTLTLVSFCFLPFLFDYVLWLPPLCAFATGLAAMKLQMTQRAILASGRYGLASNRWLLAASLGFLALFITLYVFWFGILALMGLVSITY